MIPLGLRSIAALLGGELVGPGDRDARVVSATADSRAAAPGTLFVALAGEHTDGHRYVGTAAAQGAVAALTERPVPDALCLVVADPLVAFGRLARHLVDLGRADGLQVVGITGSQGKTSTKDLLAQVLEAVGPTVAPVGNLNNELGVPLTITRLESDTRFLVSEMGARGIGHIAYLCDVAAPAVGVVLNVGHAHVGEFGGQAAIATAKGELVEALPDSGWAVLNADDPLVWQMRQRTSARVLAVSTEHRPPGPAVWASDLAVDPLGRYRFRLHTEGIGPDGEAEVALQGAGRHQVANATAAAAAALALGVGLEVVADRLSAATARSRWRMELHEAQNDVLVVNDSYNANPDSMRAAIATTVELGRGRAGRTWAVLGDMLELGADAPDEHHRVGAYAARSGLDRMVAIGEFADQLAAGAQAEGLAGAGVVADKAAAVAEVLAGLGRGDVVLVKASRGLTLNTVADEIVARVGPAEGNEHA